MGLLVRTCPNPSCEYSVKLRRRFYSKIGSFTCKWNNQCVPRYRCRGCKKSFSTSTFRRTYRQKKPYLNKAVFEFYASGTSQRRLAKVLRTDRKTVARKFLWAAKWAREKHLEELVGATIASEIQFDEMESFEHTRLKPLSISLAVRADTSQIIDVQVGTLNYKGRLANFAFKKYGPRVDTSQAAVLRTLQTIKDTGLKNPTIVTDAKPTYPNLIAEVFAEAKHAPVKVEKMSMAQRLFRKGRRNVNDPLFAFNLVAAKIRHDLSRMARKVWVTTKRENYLQAHLDLYIAYANGYKLPA